MVRPLVLTLSVLLAGCLPMPAPASPSAPVEPTEQDANTRLRSELLTAGPIEDRVSNEEADLVIFYGSEHKGSMETCGCPKRPRGSLTRLQGYIDAAREATPNSPDVLLHAGYFLEDAIGLGGSLREDVPLQNRWMAKGLEAQDWDALNLSFNDLPGWRELARSGTELPVTSANIRVRETFAEAKPWPTWRRIQRRDLTIGVVGVSNAGVSFVATPEYQINAVVEAAGPVIAEAAAESDVVILLAYQAPGEAKALANAYSEIDVVVDAYKHREAESPFDVGNAIWVKSHYETQRLGELRIWLEDGAISKALDRKIDLDPDVTEDEEVRNIMLEARKEIAEKQRALFGQ